MSYNLSPEEIAAAARQVRQYGQRANEIVKELLASCREGDPRAGGALVRECYEEPEKLMLVIGILTSAVVNGVNGPMATPEELGVEDVRESEPWQVGVTDQLQAAVENGDVNTFAAIALDGQIRALIEDFKESLSTTGYYPDTASVVRSLLLADRVTVTAVAAEAIRRLTLTEAQRG